MDTVTERENEKVTCFLCSGTGKIPCTECGGSGRIIVQRGDYGGSGLLSSPCFCVSGEQTCHACSGTGSVRPESVIPVLAYIGAVAVAEVGFLVIGNWIVSLTAH